MYFVVMCNASGWRGYPLILWYNEKNHPIDTTNGRCGDWHAIGYMCDSIRYRDGRKFEYGADYDS
jgi:hypothetical protein